MMKFLHQSNSSDLICSISKSTNTLIKIYFAFFIISTTAVVYAEEINCSDPNTDGRFSIEKRKAICLQDPGWFDVGAGMAVIQNANNQGQNSVGNLVTLRAYPLGRWYAPLKSVSIGKSEILSAKAAILKAKADLLEQKKQALKLDKNNASVQNEVNNAQQEVDNAANDFAFGMQSALSDFGDMYAVKEIEYQFLQRFSFFFGRSIGGFDTSIVQGDINAFGMALDLAPQFSVVWGRAYYNLLPQAGDTNTSMSNNFFGIQLNLNAFKTMRNLTGSM